MGMANALLFYTISFLSRTLMEYQLVSSTEPCSVVATKGVFCVMGSGQELRGRSRENECFVG